MRKFLMALLFPALLLLTLGTNFRRPPSVFSKLTLRPGLSASDRVTGDINQTNLAQALIMYSELTGRTQLPKTSPISQQADELFGGCLSQWHVVKPPIRIPSGIEYHRDGLFSVGEIKEHLENVVAANGLVLVPDGKRHFRVIQSSKL